MGVGKVPPCMIDCSSYAVGIGRFILTFVFRNGRLSTRLQSEIVHGLKLALGTSENDSTSPSIVEVVDGVYRHMFHISCLKRGHSLMSPFLSTSQ